MATHGDQAREGQCSTSSGQVTLVLGGAAQGGAPLLHPARHPCCSCGKMLLGRGSPSIHLPRLSKQGAERGVRGGVRHRQCTPRPNRSLGKTLPHTPSTTRKAAECHRQQDQGAGRRVAVGAHALP